MNEQLHVSHFQIKVIMLQIVPGSEVEVVDRFTSELKKLNRRHQIFKVLGNYDLFIIYESPEFEPDIIDMGTIPHILKSNELLCFPWEIKDSSGTTLKGGFNFADLDKKILGLSFAKINPTAILRAGAKVENSLISFFHDVPNLSVLGSFGWNEIVFLVYGETIKDTYEALIELADLKVAYVNDNKTIEALFLKTLSFLGINFDLINMILSESDYLTNAIPEKINNNFFPHLYITCCPEMMGKIVTDVSNCFGAPNIIVGAEDLSIHITNKIKTWGAFLTELLKFRQRNKAELFSTSVKINRRKQRKKSVTTEQSPSTRLNGQLSSPISISAEESDFLKKKYHRTFQMHFLNTLYTFNNLIQNKIVRAAYIDMIPFAKEIRANALSEESNIQQIALYLDHFIFGAQQRASSTYSGIDNIEYRFSAFKGGIQRVLQAIELLPKSMLSNIGYNWPGIINAGEDDTFRSDYVVLNIPSDALFTPSEWWGLFHEIGHVATLNTDLLDFTDRSLDHFLGGQIGLVKEDPGFAEFIDLCWEISADIFDYKFGFLKDIETYFESLWGYLESFIKRKEVSEHKIETYIFRSFYVYLYHSIWYERRFTIDALSSSDEISRQLSLYIEYLNSIKTRTGLPTRNLNNHAFRNISLTSMTLKPILIHLRSKYKEIAKKESTIEAAYTPPINDIINTLTKGQVYWENIEHPEMIIYRLKKDKINDIKTNIATILSFWHTFHRRFRKDIAL